LGRPAAATALKSPTKPPRSPHKAASKWHDQDEAKHDKEQEHARAAQAHANDGDDPEKEHRQRMEAPPDAADSWAGAADAEALSSGLESWDKESQDEASSSTKKKKKKKSKK